MRLYEPKMQLLVHAAVASCGCKSSVVRCGRVQSPAAPLLAPALRFNRQQQKRTAVAVSYHHHTTGRRFRLVVRVRAAERIEGMVLNLKWRKNRKQSY